MVARIPLVLATSCLVLSACFSPNITDEETDDASTGGPGTSETDEPVTLTTGPGTPTTGTPTTGTPTTGTPTTGTPTTGTPTTAADDSTTDDTAGEVGGPGCGDGEVNGEEECDEGEDNGGATCTELCTIALCGDGIVSGEEACDEGADNGMELGDCAPDCSTLVEARAITMAFDYSQNGDLGGLANSVAFSDMSCENSGAVGYKALFANGVDRRATVSPNVGDGQIDWVLRPWTRYLRDDGELVWVTDASALLGVRDGQAMDLVNAINDTSSSGAFTGMRSNWVTHAVQNCADWNSVSSSTYRPEGDSESAEAGRFLDNEVGVGPHCASYALAICVEQ